MGKQFIHRSPKYLLSKLIGNLDVLGYDLDVAQRLPLVGDEVQGELRCLLERLTPGGRIPVHEMHNLICQGNPDLEVSLRELGDAMRAVTGNASKPSNGVSYYYDYQLPVRGDNELDSRLAELQGFFEQFRKS